MHIPMAWMFSARMRWKCLTCLLYTSYLLKAAYPDIELADGREIRFAELYFYMDEDGSYDGFGMSWQEDRRHNVSISYFSYEDSTSLQARCV